jgi:hypothetical protein
VFHWTAPTGTGLSYRLQISRSPDFLPAQFDSAAIAPTTCSFPILNAFTKYYWRVSAANQAGAGPWSAVWSFITSPPPPPQAPLLVSPIAGAKDVPIPPTLRWNRSATATSYAYQIGADALFMPPLIDSRTISDTVALSSNLQYNATYYWRVNAQNPGGGSPWSEVRSFTTGPLVSVKEAVPATGVRITGVFPEPANDAATVECSLPAGERVDLRLYNRFGVLAARRTSDPVSPGFIREQFDVGHLPSGLYCLILRSASGSSIRKLLILH